MKVEEFCASTFRLLDPIDGSTEWQLAKVQAAHATHTGTSLRILNAYILRRLWTQGTVTMSLRAWLSDAYTPEEWIANVSVHVVPHLEKYITE